MGNSCCQGTLDVRALEARQRRVLIIVLMVNIATFIMMIAAAAHSGSSSLLSGALDNLGDALTYGLSLAVIGAGVAAKSRVALVKGALILAAAIAVGMQIAYRLTHPGVPLFESMGLAALGNLAANLFCLWLLTPYRHGDINMASVWECSRNDAFEGIAVLGAALGVWLFGSGWPDLLIAVGLLLMFLRSAARVFRSAWSELQSARTSS